MNWRFWTKSKTSGNGGRGQKIIKPRELPEAVGRKLVVEMKIDPDEAWSLKYISRPLEDNPGAYGFRLFHPDRARAAGVDVKDWTSLDAFPDLILYQGIYHKSAKKVNVEGFKRG